MLWKDAQQGVMPESEAYAVFRRDSEQGVNQNRRAQQELRRERQNGPLNCTLYTPDGGELPIQLANPEVYWRWDCLQVWYNAVELHSPESRDYADWLCPYLRPGCFREPSYALFWLREVNGDLLPLNRLTGLIAFYQLRKKITHGNAADQLHASHWLRSDLFVTADRAFYDILSEVATRHYPNQPHPVLIERSATTVRGQLEPYLTSCQTARSA